VNVNIRLTFTLPLPKPSMVASSPRGNDFSLQGQPLVLISTAKKVKPFPIHICPEKYMDLALS
jgi:hypothetical protein